ncbi:MAG: hypothetical protein PVJ92_02025 [Candidatus Dependentiae bacterium]|jgi:hypothetical protein
MKTNASPALSRGLKSGFRLKAGKTSARSSWTLFQDLCLLLLGMILLCGHTWAAKNTGGHPKRETEEQRRARILTKVGRKVPATDTTVDEKEATRDHVKKALDALIKGPLPERGDTRMAVDLGADINNNVELAKAALAELTPTGQPNPKREYAHKVISSLLSLYDSPSDLGQEAIARIKEHLDYDINPSPAPPTKFERLYKKATGPLPYTAYVAADTYLDRKHAHDEADALSQTDTSKMRWTNDGRLARAGAFGLRKAFAFKDITRTLESTPDNIAGRGFQDPTWSRSAALTRLALIAANFLYQGWTRKRAQFTDNELDDLAAYNYHVGVTDDVKELQAAIKRNADIRAGVRVAGDGVLDKLAHPHADALKHGGGIWQEFADMRHRYKLAKAYDKVRARVKEWRHAHPHLKAPSAGMGGGGLGDIMGMLGGMGGDAGQGGPGGDMSPEEMQELQAMMAQMGNPNGAGGAGGMDMQKLMEMAAQMGGPQNNGPQRGMNPNMDPQEGDTADQFDMDDMDEQDAAFWRTGDAA